MEAKQKAQQLVNRFRTETDTILMTNLAKPFALIAVDEMIQEFVKIDPESVK